MKKYIVLKNLYTNLFWSGSTWITPKNENDVILCSRHHLDDICGGDIYITVILVKNDIPIF